jgi:hypothetical protein
MAYAPLLFLAAVIRISIRFCFLIGICIRVQQASTSDNVGDLFRIRRGALTKEAQ